MSYLNRANGYEPTGRVNSEPRKRYAKDKDNHIAVGKVTQRCAKLVTQPWWACCPVCPCATGFMKTETHGSALSWALEHAEEHRKTVFIERMKAVRNG